MSDASWRHVISTLIWSYLAEEVVKGFVSYFEAGIDGTDKKDVGEDDEDANVKTEHKCCSVEDKKASSLGRTALINPS